MLSDGIVTFLLANARIANLVGTRIYPYALPQDPTLPAIVYNDISDAPEYSHSGSSGLEAQRFQFDCWDDTPDDAEILREALKAAVSGYCGPMGSMWVYAAFVMNQFGDQDPATGLFRKSMDVKFWNKEA